MPPGIMVIWNLSLVLRYLCQLFGLIKFNMAIEVLDFFNPSYSMLTKSRGQRKSTIRKRAG